MKATSDSQTRRAGRARRAGGILLALAAAVISAAAQTVPAAGTNSAPAAVPVVEAEPGEYNNSVTLGFGSLLFEGDKAQLMRRTQLPAGQFGGLEELHYERMLGRSLLQLDGRGVFNNGDYRDYSVKLGLQHPDVGYVRGGYEQFPIFYDGSGGHSVRSNAWVSPYSDELHVDRGRAWIEAGLTLPDWPVFTLRYAYDFREGRKDSTIWGDYNLTQNPASQVLRGIIPTYLDLTERRHALEADATHTLGNTAFGVGLRYERDDVSDSRNILRRAGEPTRVRAVTQTDHTDTDIFNAHGFTETRFNSKVMFTTGYSYTRLDTDIAGSRIYGATYGSPFLSISPNQQSNDEGFYGLSGGSRVDQYVANLSFLLSPAPQVSIVPALRLEHQDQVGSAMFTETRVTNATKAAALEEILNERTRNFTDVTGSLAVRYTGITNWLFYVRTELLKGQGRLKENEYDVEDEGVGPVQLTRNTDSERTLQKYTVGANWYPTRKANLAVQYYYRSRENDYEHDVDSTAYLPPATNNFYPAFIRHQSFNTHDLNARLTWRPRANLTLVSRYDLQLTSYGMQGDTNNAGIGLKEVEGAAAANHIFSQSLSWSPASRMYFQASVSYAIQRTDTPASDLTGGATNLVLDARNDYLTAGLLAGCALTPRCDLQAQYNYYRADNFHDNSSVGLPYGAGSEQHGVTVTLLNRLRKNVLWKTQYGFFTGHDQTSGGRNDYAAHLLYTSWQFLF